MAEYPSKLAPVIVRNRATAAAIGDSNTQLIAVNAELDTQTTELQGINTELNTQTTWLSSLYDLLGYGRNLLGQTITADPVTLFDAKFVADTRPLTWETKTATGGTAAKATNEPAINMTVTSTTGSRVVRQGPYIPYQAGKVLRVICTGVAAAAATSVTTKVIRRTSTGGSQSDSDATTFTTVDGITMDWSKAQIMGFDILWLGVDGIIFWMKIDEEIRPIAYREFTNSETTAYTRTMTLPVRYEIEKTANGIRSRIGFFDDNADKSVDSLGDGAFFQVEYTTASGDTMKQICCTVQSLGGWNPRGVTLKKPVLTRNSGATGTMAPLISLRLYNSAASMFCRGTINPLSLMMTNVTAGAGLYVDYEIRLYNAATHLTAPSWAAPVTGSIAEIDTVGTASGTFATDPYIVVDAGTISTALRALVNEFENTEKIVSNIAGTSRVLTVCAASTGAAQSMKTVLGWQEWL